jgi:hypothetical protein
MAIHSIAVWKTTLDDVSAWQASTFLLSSLAGYQGPLDNGGFDDREQVYNFLMAWRLATPSAKLRKVGPAAIGEGRPTAAQFRATFSKLSAAASAELLVENYLNDPACGYIDAVAIITAALVAYGEVQVAHSQPKLGGRGDKAPSLTA